MILPIAPSYYKLDDQQKMRRTLEQTLGKVETDVRSLVTPGTVALGVTTTPTCNARQGTVFTASNSAQITVQVPVGGATGRVVYLVLTNTGGSPWTVATHGSLTTSAGWTAPSVAAGGQVVIPLLCLGTTWIVF